MIRWVSGRCAALCFLADVAEEVKDLAEDVEISFVHVKRSANFVANALAKEGVSRQHFSFGVLILPRVFVCIFFFWVIVAISISPLY